MVTANTIAILGPGLLGGSVALATKASRPSSQVHIWARRESAVEQIEQFGIADLASTDLGEVTAAAELIVLATPVGIMPNLVARLLELPGLGETIITDLGSVKGVVVAAIDALLADHEGVSFVGSHPMAGKEHAGIEHARAELFQSAACVITPGVSSTPEAVQIVENFWGQLGCRTTQMRPQQHDEAVARISHLPHIAASLITSAALDGDPSIGAIAGAGLRDTTRVASGSPQMWTEILLENRAALSPALTELRDKVDAALGLLESGDASRLEALLQGAKELRDGLHKGPAADDAG
jgi:prephenate dehydrogenase